VGAQGQPHEERAPGEAEPEGSEAGQGDGHEAQQEPEDETQAEGHHVELAHRLVGVPEEAADPVDARPGRHDAHPVAELQDRVPPSVGLRDLA
jgi:hypothetical protein